MMKKIILMFVIALVLCLLSGSVDAYVPVKGYYRKNGTYVAPHVRSNPNGLKSDNYGYKGGDVYNPSYGAKGSAWDTPTTVTDPNYYTGKYYYDTKTVPTYTPPATSYTPPIATPYLQTPVYTTTIKPTVNAGTGFIAGCTSKTGFSVTTGMKCDYVFPAVAPIPNSISIEEKKIINQRTLSQWAADLLTAYNKGIITWDKAVELYSIAVKFHD